MTTHINVCVVAFNTSASNKKALTASRNPDIK